MFSLLFVLTITFTVYPGVAFNTSLKIFDGVPNRVSWFVVFLNTIYSVFDTVGRKLGS